MKRFAPFAWPGALGGVLGILALVVHSFVRAPEDPDPFFWVCVEVIMLSMLAAFLGTMGRVELERDGEPLD